MENQYTVNMSKQNIIEGSKTIAKYLGWVYIPHNNLQGFSKAGWFKTRKRVKKEDITLPLNKDKIVVDGMFLQDSAKIKSGWFVVNDMYVKFVCRSHNELRFYNSMDALIPAIEKLENEDLSEFHYEWEDGRGMHNNFMSLDFNRWHNESHYSIDLELDPAIFIGSHKGEGILKDTFHATVEAINYINNLRDE